MIHIKAFTDNNRIVGLTFTADGLPGWERTIHVEAQGNAYSTLSAAREPLASVILELIEAHGIPISVDIEEPVPATQPSPVVHPAERPTEPALPHAGEHAEHAHPVTT